MKLQNGACVRYICLCEELHDTCLAALYPRAMSLALCQQHLLPPSHRNWQIKVTVTPHLIATTRRLLVPFLISHYGESELTLRSTRKYADVSSPVPCQVAILFNPNEAGTTKPSP